MSPTYNKVCPICNKPFIAKRSNGRFCSKECLIKFYNPIVVKQLISKTCPVCDHIFYTDDRYKTKLYCSASCSKFASLEQRKLNLKNNPDKYKSTTGYIRLRFQILQRDNFHCQYCGRGIEHGVVLQVDHVKPKSKHGGHNKDNYITACQDCNLGKTDVLIELNEYQKKQLLKPLPELIK